MRLGRLEPIKSIRSVWEDEASDFTPWLAEPENLSLLAETLGFPPDAFTEAQSEVQVSGSRYRADIVCRNTTHDEDALVLIEAQFGASDHDHLGKLLTYASGIGETGIETVILVCERLRDEHRAALDWLNRISNETHNFFAVEIELWRIGQSDYAPRFNVRVQPNDWARAAARSGTASAMSDTDALKLAYWTAFGELMESESGPLQARKIGTSNYLVFSTGVARTHFAAKMQTNGKKIGVEIVLQGPTSTETYNKLLANRELIETAYGHILDWDPIPDRQRCRIEHVRADIDPTDEADWPAQHAWLRDQILALNRAILPHLEAHT